MDLQNPTRKMSKSEGGRYHAIGLLDDPKEIRRKLARAVTDSERDIVFNSRRPGLFNLLTIYQALSGLGEEEIEDRFRDKGYGDLKGELADLVIETLAPLQEKYREITADPRYLDGILEQGAAKAGPVVEGTMDRVRSVMGFR